MKKLNQYRQGDILIEEVEQVPATAKKQKHNGQITVALGEATGHHHTIFAERDSADWWKDDNGDQYVTLKKASALKHQEHGKIRLKQNRTLLFSRQREYTPEAIRNVAD